jgi:hypothetical protein
MYSVFLFFLVCVGGLSWSCSSREILNKGQEV